MNKFLEFLKSKGHLILFLILESIAIFLLYRNSNYHYSVLTSSSNIITGAATEMSSTVDGYLGLREVNIDLMERNATLEREVLMLRSRIDRLTTDTLSYSKLMQDTVERAFPYQYVTARVVGNVIYSKSNYITIDKGRTDGIQPDMGVLSDKGIVGVVKSVGAHYAVVIPLINNKFSLSCKVGRDEHIGSLNWDGYDLEHSTVTHLPKHLRFIKGDSVFTSGYSAIFPEHIFIGTVQEQAPSPDDNFNALRIKLNTGFNKLKYVHVLINYERAERESVEEEAEVR